MNCPNCGLINPPRALHCDCGCVFGTLAIEAPHIRQKAPNGGLAIRFGLLSPLLAFVASLLGCDGNQRGAQKEARTIILRGADGQTLTMEDLPHSPQARMLETKSA